VTDGQQRLEMDTGAGALRRLFAAEYRARHDDVQTMLQRLAIPMLDASTGDSPLGLLRQLYGDSRA
jgi:hypothetical protein